MALTPGTTLGPYEILSPIGAGGMGEVYKARDTRLDRTVAIKVLPEHVASDPDLKQRFKRTAELGIRDAGGKWYAATSHAEIGVYPGFPTLFWGLSGFFVNDLMGKALWSSWKTGSIRVSQRYFGAFRGFS